MEKKWVANFQIPETPFLGPLYFWPLKILVNHSLIPRYPILMILESIHMLLMTGNPFMPFLNTPEVDLLTSGLYYMFIYTNIHAGCFVYNIVIRGDYITVL